MEQSVEEYLKERLLIDENQNVNTKFDELTSTIKMLIKQKCKEQRLNCQMNIEFEFDKYTNVILGLDGDCIMDAKEPKL